MGWRDLEEVGGRILSSYMKIYTHSKDGKNLSQAVINYKKEGNQSENTKRTLE